MGRLAGALLAAAAVLIAAGCGTGGVSAGGDTSRGKDLFGSKCGFCHTLADAGSQGRQGPNLDDAFASDRGQGFKESTIRQVVRDQIEFASPPMPANLVKGDDAEAVAAYVASVAGLSSQAGPATVAGGGGGTTGGTSGGGTTGGGTTGGGGAGGGEGKALFSSLGCNQCHTIDGTPGTGPTMKGLAGSKVKLKGGKTVTADDAYLLESILDPDKQIVSSYPAGIMTSLIKPHSVSEANARALIAYIKTLK